jgi:hypothetical protein
MVMATIGVSLTYFVLGINTTRTGIDVYVYICMYLDLSTDDGAVACSYCFPPRAFCFSHCAPNLDTVVAFAAPVALSSPAAYVAHPDQRGGSPCPLYSTSTVWTYITMVPQTRRRRRRSASYQS